MAASDVPTSFGFPVFLRIFLPGFLGATLYLYAILSCLDPYVNTLNTSTLFSSLSLGEIIFWLFIVTIFGITVASIDFYIYQFYEGLRLWPSFLWKRYFIKSVMKVKALEKSKEDIQIKLNIQNNKIKNCDRQINSLQENKGNNTKNREYKKICDCINKYERAKILHTSEYLKLKNKLSDILYQLDEYPYNTLLEKRYPRQPTRFGNVMAEYESYSELQYGLDMSIFWQHIWLILPKDIRDEVDLKGSMADVLVYISFIFLTYSIFGSLLLTFALRDQFHDILLNNLINYLISVMQSCLPANAYNYLSSFSTNIFNSYLAAIDSASIISDHLTTAILFLIVFIISILLSFIFYKSSLRVLISYGKLIKAIFDIYRIELSKKICINVNLVPDDNEKFIWRMYGNFLMNHNANQSIKNINIKRDPPKFDPPI